MPDEQNQSILIPVDIEAEMKKSYLDYSMSVIIGRALPDVRDGLKPVHRRILFGMYELGLTSTRPYRKCAKIVWMIFAENFAHDLRAFAVRPGRSETQLVHAEENAPMHRLQAVTHVGQRAPNDHAHRIIEIGLLHLGFDVYRNQDRLVLFVWHCSSVAQALLPVL